MKAKRITSLILALALALSLCLTGCGSQGGDTQEPAGDNNTAGDDAKYTVGICQLVQHEALDAATQGFIDALNEALPGQVKIVEKNASGDSINCSTIVNGFVSDGVDLIMANATPALTAAASATSDIPILGTSITAYGVALDMEDFDGTVGGNISGTSDLADLEKQAAMITEWFPEAKKVALLFCSAEPNSRYQIEEVAKHLAGLITGVFHTRCGIPAILSGILTQLALYSINLRIMGGKANQAVSVDKYDLLLSQRYVRTLSLDNPLPLLIVLTAVIVAVLYWFFGTEKGSSVRATGANPHMARAQGINTNSNIVLGLMISNGLVALSGALLAQYQGSSDINMGRGAIVIGLAAVIIGEVIFGKLFSNIGLKLLAVSIGAIVYYIVLQIVLQIGLNTNDLKLITALIVAIFLTLSYVNLRKTRRKPRRAAKEGEEHHA